ncbi:MAG TPA: radical SAM family heme chaperone HemW [Terriglobales bacterium]|nr:radical SAM family heme chaperone HemW [Terriglobales bacterium]
MPLGLYISVPFCKTKCTYCNFASDVFSRAAFQRYVDRVCSEIEHAAETAQRMGRQFERAVDTIYLGGGTPTVLDISHLERLFVTISQNFKVADEAEITVECAPGTLTPAVLESFKRCGVNRVSLGIQSFVDQEARAVGRLHTRAVVLDDIQRLRDAGIANINVDLIAGLPHQTAESWEFSLQEAIACSAPHISVYMLEVDEDSRLGRELIAGGTKYHAHFVPNDDLTADLYVTACERLEAVGIEQYEISNFSREGFESRHNLKYWTRRPYFGFGVDAHSMLQSTGENGVRFATPDSLEAYIAAEPLKRTEVSSEAALEESFFLGLRLSQGVDLQKITEQYGDQALAPLIPVISELIENGLLERENRQIRLTLRGRLLSNDVFEKFISVTA